MTAWTGTCAAQIAQWVGRLHGFGPDKVWATYSAESPLVVLTGDFNGDGLDDLVYFHRSTPGKEGHVEVRLNTGGEFAAAVRWHNSFCFGNEIPKVGDFNGDGRSDIATFIRSSQGGEAQGDVYVGLSSGSAFVSSRWHELKARPPAMTSTSETTPACSRSPLRTTLRAIRSNSTAIRRWP